MEIIEVLLLMAVAAALLLCVPGFDAEALIRFFKMQ